MIESRTQFSDVVDEDANCDEDDTGDDDAGDEGDKTQFKSGSVPDFIFKFPNLLR